MQRYSATSLLFTRDTLVLIEDDTIETNLENTEINCEKRSLIHLALRSFLNLKHVKCKAGAKNDTRRLIKKTLQYGKTWEYFSLVTYDFAEYFFNFSNRF